MSDTYDQLKQVAWEAAQLYAALHTDEHFVQIHDRNSGVDIPPSTRIVVTVRLEHEPDAFFVFERALEAVTA